MVWQKVPEKLGIKTEVKAEQEFRVRSEGQGLPEVAIKMSPLCPHTYRMLPPAYCNWLSTLQGHRHTPVSETHSFKYLEERVAAALQSHREYRGLSFSLLPLTLSPPCQLKKAPTRQSNTYLVEKSGNRLTRTKANKAAKAPYPFNTGHDRELNDLERMKHPAAVLSTPPVYKGFCVCVCLCVIVF